MEASDKMEVQATVAGQQMVLHGPTGAIIIAILLIGWFGFAYLIYDGIKVMSVQHTTVAATTAAILSNDNAERRREHDQLTHNMANLICILAIPEKERTVPERIAFCLQQFKRASFMVPS
jgi:hypothetical protein